MKLILFNKFFSIIFLTLLSLVSSNEFFLIISKFSEINKSAAIFELFNRPPELIIGPIKKPKSSIVRLFSFLFISYKVFKTILFSSKKRY